MKKNIIFWALYDFANSFVLMAFLFYFSQWLVADQGKPAWWYNGALIVSSILFIITAPILSKKIDATKTKIVGLRLWTAGAFVGFLITALLVMLVNGQELLVTIIYTFSTYAYLSSFLYYTPMLNDLSSRENRSWISGIGQSANAIGQVAGILVTLPFVNGFTLFGDPGRAQALFPGVIIFGILALPMLLFYKESLSTVSVSVSNTQNMNLISMFKKVFSYKSLAFMFLAYFLFSDALLTFANNFPLYLETVHGVSDTVKSLLTASILILAAIGCIIFGKIADKKGNVKTLRWLVVVWVLLFLAMAFVTNFKILIPIFLFAGILFGPIWSISRSLVGHLAPEDLTASSYSYYVVAERFSTFVGPLVWSIALITVGEGAHGYQTGLFFLAILMAISFVVLKKVEEPVKV